MAAQSTILIVEDNESAQEIFTLRMVRAGHRVIHALDGVTALEKMKAEKPDLILLDLLMPGVSGFEVLERMQDDPEIENIPTIVVTAISLPEARERCLKLGAWDFVTKPVDFIELLKKIEGCLLRKPRDSHSHL